MIDFNRQLINASTAQSKNTKTKILLRGEKGVITEFSLYQHIVVSLVSTIVNPHTKSLRIDARINPETVELTKRSEEQTTLKNLIREREEIQVNEKRDLYCRLDEMKGVLFESSREKLLEDVRKVQSNKSSVN